MKVEEAIFCEKSYIGETNCTDCKYYGTDTCESRESHRMAIEALEQKSCKDLIRREDALQSLCKAVHKNDDNIPCPNQRISCLWSKTKVQDYVREIYKISPVTPQTKTAHWIYKIYGGFHEQGDWYCSNCNYKFNYGNGHAKFCPECGYEMSEPPEEVSEYDKRRDQPY